MLIIKILVVMSTVISPTVIALSKKSSLLDWISNLFLAYDVIDIYSSVFICEHYYEP